MIEYPLLMRGFGGILRSRHYFALAFDLIFSIISSCVDT